MLCPFCCCLGARCRGFPNQMIEQINIALEQKGSGNFSAWVIEACRRRLTSEKRAYTSIKSDEE
ncbi:YlcI/YnfO family protein [Escherichia coli]|uniref:YlcI/YnfO family protein n=1 Tax=Escherichia coli TaxID=562 RepID=UPI00201FA13F|nr:YlcI/YnfO family protein [Escherichia coli]